MIFANPNPVLRALLLAILGLMAVNAAPATNQIAVGAVKVDPQAWSVSFPAAVNMRTGLVEYLVVHDSGKIHESIFRTAVTARPIHAAALLFATPSTNAAPTNAARSVKIRAIEVAWEFRGVTKKVAAPDLIHDKEKRRPLRQTAWEYHGSRLIDGVFLAERDGSLIAIMEDRDALIDQDTPDAANDENWEPVKDALPEVGRPVTVTLFFAKTTP